MKVIIAGEQSTYKSSKERILNRLRFDGKGPMEREESM